MADKIHLSVVSAEGVKLDQMVSYVCIPAEQGTVGVLANHMPMLCAVKEGFLNYRFGQDETGSFLVKDGLASVSANEVSLLVSYAEQASANEQEGKQEQII
mgnify:CR=1 FL=1